MTNIEASQGPVTPLPPQPSFLPASQEVLEALYSIQTTPVEHSFLSRLQGTMSTDSSGLIAVDWETVTPWMNLMADIREHYSLA